MDAIVAIRNEVRLLLEGKAGRKAHPPSPCWDIWWAPSLTQVSVQNVVYDMAFLSVDIGKLHRIDDVSVFVYFVQRQHRSVVVFQHRLIRVGDIPLLVALPSI